MSDEMNGMSPADFAALMNGANGGNGFGNFCNNPFFYLMFMYLFGNGFGGFGGYNNNAAQSALTRAEMFEGFNNQTLQSDIKGIQNTAVDGFASVAQNLCCGFNGVNSNANTNANMLNQTLNRSIYENQMGINSINNNIGSLKYEMAQNCCELKNAMHCEGEATRSLITQNTIQDLRDKLAAKDNELQSAQITLANNAQTRTILDSLGKFVPTTPSCYSNGCW
jgi:hypothetical protein